MLFWLRATTHTGRVRGRTSGLSNLPKANKELFELLLFKKHTEKLL
jgi:hypothetical protein